MLKFGSFSCRADKQARTESGMLKKCFTVNLFLMTGITEKELSYLPVGIVLPIREAIFHCRCNPPSDWPKEAYHLVK